MDDKEQKRLAEEELDRKLEELDKKISPAYLRKRLKLALYKRVEDGDLSALTDIKKLEALEVTPDAAPSASLTQSAPSAEGAGAPPEEEEIGIPQRLLVKRHYTLSPAAIEARRKNAQCRKPGNEGNKNAWKTGLHARDFIEGRIKPCLSTCPIYDDCELVSDGYTKPGGICLDKAAVITTYSSIMDAVKNKKHDEFNEVSGLYVAEIMHVARMLMEDVMREGTTVKRERYDKNGVLQLIEYVSHPSLMALPKIIADLGLTPREMNITPKAIKDDKNTEEANKTAAGLMSDMARRIRDREGQKAGEGENE
jgi:hypothetical protein